MNNQASDFMQCGDRKVDTVNPRRGKLLNGNRSGDPSTAPRCGAKTRAGAPCRGPGMWSEKSQRFTRCRLHGGKSTGPRTPEGLEKCRRSNWKHGKRSKAVIQQRRAKRAELRTFLADMQLCIAEARAWLRLRRREISEDSSTISVQFASRASANLMESEHRQAREGHADQP